MLRKLCVLSLLLLAFALSAAPRIRATSRFTTLSRLEIFPPERKSESGCLQRTRTLIKR